MNQWFTRFSSRASQVTGSSWTFLLAVVIIAVWAVSGPLFGFSDTWQLVINTGTTIVTFLMVFLIQNTQNRDAKALHLKLNELIHVLEPAHNELIAAEDLTEQELQGIMDVYRKVAQREGKERDFEQALQEQLAGSTPAGEAATEASAKTLGPAQQGAGPV